MRKTLPIIVVLAILLSGCSSSASDSTAGSQASTGAISVEVAAVTTGDISSILSYTGNLQAKQSVKITPSISGRVDAVNVKIGDQVKAGTTLATIEKELYDTQVKQAEIALQVAQLKVTKMEQGPRAEELTAAEAGVRAAQAALDGASNVSDDQRTVAAANMARTEAALKLAQSEYDKIQYADQAGMTPQAIQLEQATISYQSAVAAYNMQVNPSEQQLASLRSVLAQARLKLALTKAPYVQVDFDTAKAGVGQAEGALKMAQLQADNATIRAPFDGIVADVYVTQGTLAGPQVPVVLLASGDEEIVCDVEENRVGLIKEGQSVSLQVSAFPDRDFPAQVSVVAPSGDAKTHTFAVRVTPQDSENLLRGGMFAKVDILAEAQKDALLVPQAAIVSKDGESVVYVVHDGIAEQRKITTGLDDGERIQVLSGLQAGDQVAIAGLQNLVDQAAVDVIGQ